MILLRLALLSLRNRWLTALLTVIAIAVVWGFFIYSMVANKVSPFSPEFNRALAETIATTIYLIILALISATIIGLILVGIVAVIDAILTAICELGVDDLRKVPGLGGACFTLGTVAIKAIAYALYNYDVMIDASRNDMVSNSYVATSTGRTSPQLLAEEKFKQTLDLLNISSNGRFLFSGRTSDQEPVASYSEIMVGDANRAGLKTLISERQAADGITGLGRLTVTMPTTTSVALGREAAR